jgi:hypothetical protein
MSTIPKLRTVDITPGLQWGSQGKRIQSGGNALVSKMKSLAGILGAGMVLGPPMLIEHAIDTSAIAAMETQSFVRDPGEGILYILLWTAGFKIGM